MVLFLDEKYKKAKKFVLLFAFFISLVFLAKTVSAGCCIATDYSGYYTANNAMGCDGFYYDVNCNDKSLEPYISQMCCILNISQTNKCYYGSMKFCEYKAEQEGATDYELSDGDYGADGTLCSLSNVQGTCPSPLPEVNCSKTYNIIVQGCIDEEGKSAFFCTREGKLISNCELCLEDNCGSLVCNKQTGSCEMVSANNCTTIGYECCADCKSDKSEPRYDYGTENEGSCPQNLPRCCEECKTTQYCCEFKSQCPESTGKGSCSSGWECSHACEQWNCALNQKIASSSNQHEVCWCSNEKRYTASDSGWCCEVPGVEGGVYSPVSCSEIGEAKVSGLVKDSAESKGIAGAWVFLPAHGIVSLPTGATGDYSISGLKTGVSYTVSAYASEYYMLSKRILMDALDKSVDFLMIKIGSTQCNPVHPAAISGFKAFGQQGKKEVSVEWDKNCSELISAYYLKRKDWSAAIILPASADSYIDSNVEWGKNYTYEIRAIYQNKNTPISSTTVKMGSALCEGVLPGNEFCLDSQNRKNTENATLRRTCDENNNVAENVYINTGVYGYETADCSEYDAAEGGEHLCVLTKGFPQEGTGEVISRCKRKDACEATGNPLGLFYDRNVCYAFDYNCYYEFSGTSVDICADCNAKLKCFDFISKESCMNNDCGLKCNWTSTNKEFSKGICYPEEEYTGTEYCDLCNNLFMNCDEDTCSKLGKCIAKQDGCSVCPASTNCSSYKDQKSCEGYPFDMINPCPPPTCGAVKEYYCQNGVMQNITTVCPSGYTCQDGACKPTGDITQLPDLVIPKVTVSNYYPKVGDTYAYFDVTIKNLGSISAIPQNQMPAKLNGLDVLCGLNSYPTDLNSNNLVLSYTHANPLAPNETASSRVATIPNSILLKTSGNKHIFCTIDPYNKISELKEDNNNYDFWINVYPNPNITCTDSDGGQNVLVKGTVTYNGQTYTDKCSDKVDCLSSCPAPPLPCPARCIYHVEENFCTNGKIMSAILPCPSGYTCQDGACKPMNTCTDSDGGNNSYVKGTVNRDGKMHTDTCLSTTTLKEYTCEKDNSNGGWKDYMVICSSGYTCQDGECKPMNTCTDSDGGRNYFKKGVMISGVNDSGHWDTCINNTTLVEYYCENAIEGRKETYICPNSYTCQDGACKPTVTTKSCTDSDGGNNIYAKGTVTYNGATYTDECAYCTGACPPAPQYCNQEHPNTNDACHLVRCSWNSTSNTCIKDGNFDKIDDCKNFYLLEKSSCEKDNTPPLTKITSDLTIHKNDKINFTMSEPVKEFVYCIDKEDNCCPSINKTFDSGGEANKWQISPLEDDATQYVFQSNGIYYVRFYATDKYDNVEAVESVPIYVIKNILDAKVVALFTNADKYNLTVITEMSAPAKCSFEINPDIRNSIVKNDFAISEYKLYLELQFKNVNYTSYRFVLNCRDEYANEYNGTFPLRKYGESKFNISIIAPYYPNGVPAISYGSYLLMLNFSESVNVNAVNYQLVDGSYKGMIEYKGNSEGKKEWSYRIIVPNNENAVKEIEGFMNAQLKITAVSEGNPEIIYTEADADNPFFTIDTKPPTAEITIG